MYWHMYWRYKSVFPISSKVQSKVATPGNVRSAVGITNNYYLRTQTNSKYGLGNSDHWIKKNQILTSTSAINNLYNVIYVNVMCNDMFCKIVFSFNVKDWELCLWAAFHHCQKYNECGCNVQERRRILRNFSKLNCPITLYIQCI